MDIHDNKIKIKTRKRDQVKAEKCICTKSCYILSRYYQNV